MLEVQPNLVRVGLVVFGTCCFIEECLISGSITTIYLERSPIAIPLHSESLSLAVADAWKRR